MAVYEDGDGFAYAPEYLDSRSNTSSAITPAQRPSSRLSRLALDDPASGVNGAGGGPAMTYKTVVRRGWERIEDLVLRPSSSSHSQEEAQQGSSKNTVVVEQGFELTEVRPTSFEEVPSMEKKVH